MAGLQGQTVQSTYDGLLKTIDNQPLNGTLKALTDGDGNVMPIEASTSGVAFTADVDFTNATITGLSSGTSGTSGVNGTAGTSGTSGTSGLDGSAGTSGTSGVNGDAGTSGTSGTSGVNGTSGTSGISGIGFTWRDTWNYFANYNVNDVVYYVVTGASYVAIAPSLSQLPTDTNYWELMANAGAAGDAGSSGTSGTSGDAGTSGTSGINGDAGSSGTSGTSGSSGISNDGTSGTSGTSGSSGVGGAPSFSIGRGPLRTGSSTADEKLGGTILIPANTFGIGDVIIFKGATGSPSPDPITNTIYTSMWINPDPNTVIAGVTIGDGGAISAGNRSMYFEHTLYIQSATESFMYFNSSATTTDIGNSGGFSSYADGFYKNIDWTVDQYVYFSYYIEGAGDTYEQRYISIKG